LIISICILKPPAWVTSHLGSMAWNLYQGRGSSRINTGEDSGNNNGVNVRESPGGVSIDIGSPSGVIGLGAISSKTFAVSLDLCYRKFICLRLLYL
jgi:hypothetical protein